MKFWNWYFWGFIRKSVLLKNYTRVICSCWDLLGSRKTLVASAISSIGNHIELTPVPWFVTSNQTLDISLSVHVCCSCSLLCFVIRWCERHFWHLTRLFITDPFANTCCSIELISDSSPDFTTLELNLAHPASKKEWAAPMDKHWFHPLVPSGQWLVFDLLFFNCYHANGAQSWKDLHSAGL